MKIIIDSKNLIISQQADSIEEFEFLASGVRLIYKDEPNLLEEK